jgi:hypothetical protein
LLDLQTFGTYCFRSGAYCKAKTQFHRTCLTRSVNLSSECHRSRQLHYNNVNTRLSLQVWNKLKNRKRKNAGRKPGMSSWSVTHAWKATLEHKQTISGLPREINSCPCLKLNVLSLLSRRSAATDIGFPSATPRHILFNSHKQFIIFPSDLSKSRLLVNSVKFFYQFLLRSVRWTSGSCICLCLSRQLANKPFLLSWNPLRRLYHWTKAGNHLYFISFLQTMTTGRPHSVSNEAKCRFLNMY